MEGRGAARLGWPDAGQGSRPTLRDRFSSDLRAAPSGPEFDELSFASLHLLDDEWAAEIVNRTVHAVMVYPPLMRDIQQDRQARTGDPTPAHA